MVFREAVEFEWGCLSVRNTYKTWEPDSSLKGFIRIPNPFLPYG